jgi:hypothetical protein
MRSIRKALLLCVPLLVALSLVPAAGAAAKAKKSHPSSAIAVESVGPDAVTGHVSSDGRACRVQRQVTLYRVNSGSSVPSGEFVGSTWTRADGSWSVAGPLYPSEFFAVVERKSAKGVVCAPATSNSLRWG